MSQLQAWQEAERERMMRALEPLCDALLILSAAGVLTDDKAIELLASAWRDGKRDAHAAPTIPASATGYRYPGADQEVVFPTPRKR